MMDKENEKHTKKLEGVKLALQQDDCILFIGSGVSRWSGLPSWTTLIDELAKYVESVGEDATLVKTEAEFGDLLQAASYGVDKLSKNQFSCFIRKVCQCGIAEPHLIHEKIIKLGKNCFITTNYDTLLEDALCKWRIKDFFNTITNKQLTEMAQIVQAKSKNFIYKPHGDVGDADSIVLTREQYRGLLMYGERHAALESLKSLLLSRPVIYIGFGLRDPDFLYIRDILLNLYQGNTREHYAIMADVSNDEILYWKKNYGIHLIGYYTKKLPDDSISHENIMNLLDELNNHKQVISEKNFNPQGIEEILSMIRYASILLQHKMIEPELTMHINQKMDSKMTINKFSHTKIDVFLDCFSGHAIVIGLPGAGKTYSFRRAVYRCAELLNSNCIKGLITKGMVVPVYIDLKLYDGNLVNMISESLPQSLPFEKLIEYFDVKIFLDSFNEMPKEIWEKSSYLADFEEFLKKYKNISIIVGSRRTDGLDKFNLKTYYLDEIDKNDIKTVLEQMYTKKIDFLDDEVYKIISKPFYFQYIVSRKIEINKIKQPKDFFEEFFLNIESDFYKRFKCSMDLVSLLSATAYTALDCGMEAFPINILYGYFNSQEEITPDDIINWLIYKNILIPSINGHISFVHQSITEYLAAFKFVKLYNLDHTYLKNKLRLNRWDQAIFLALNLLPEEDKENFIKDLFEVDFLLAIRSVKFVEYNQEKIVSKILNDILDNSYLQAKYEYNLDWIVINLPVSMVHESDIRNMMSLGNSLGGAAVYLLDKLYKDNIKEELLQLLFKYYDDYNFCRNSVANVFCKYIKEDDLESLVILADSLQEKYDIENNGIEMANGFISAVGFLFSKFNVSTVAKYLISTVDLKILSSIRSEILLDSIRDKKNSEALTLAGDLLINGHPRASITIYFIAEFSDSNLCWDSFSEMHINVLINYILSDVWALKTLNHICFNKPTLKEYLREQAKRFSGITKAAILSIISENDKSEVFYEFNSIIEMDDIEIDNESLDWIKDLNLNWSGYESIFMNLMKKKNLNLAKALMGESAPPIIEGIEHLDIFPIEWWLDWIYELSNCASSNLWIITQIVGLITSYSSNSEKKEFIYEFNKSNCKYKKLLLNYVLPKIELTTDEFSEESIEYILSELAQTAYTGTWRNNVLAYSATEEFIIKRLVPIYEVADGMLRENIKQILETAGKRFGKRYIFETSVTSI